MEDRLGLGALVALRRSGNQGLNLLAKHWRSCEAIDVGSRERSAPEQDKKLRRANGALISAHVNHPHSLDLRVQLREQNGSGWDVQLKTLDTLAVLRPRSLPFVESWDAVVREHHAWPLKRVVLITTDLNQIS